MAKKVKKIDITKPVKKSQLSIDYMKEYIKANDIDGKEEFLKVAIKEIPDKDGNVEQRYVQKDARNYFCKKYPDAIIPPAKAKVPSAVDKLLEW